MLDRAGGAFCRLAGYDTQHSYFHRHQLVYKGGIDSIPSADQDDIAKAANYVVAALGDLAAGKKVANASTKPYGYSVKYDCANAGTHAKNSLH